MPACGRWSLRSPWRQAFNHFFACHSSDSTRESERCRWEGSSKWYLRAESHQAAQGYFPHWGCPVHQNTRLSTEHAESPTLFSVQSSGLRDQILLQTCHLPKMSPISFRSTFSLCTLAARLGNFFLNLNKNIKFFPCCLLVVFILNLLVDCSLYCIDFLSKCTINSLVSGSA